jgi:iron complex transport system ATP-binding protein
MTLVAESISYGYARQQRVLHDVSCTIEPDRITAIVGPNGAGKSTLLRVLAGVARPWGGVVQWGETSIHEMSASARAQRIAFVTQRPTVAGPFSVEQVVRFGRFAGSRDDAAIDKAIVSFELDNFRHRVIHELSVGQQQRVAMARACAQLADGAAGGNASRCLLADEPLGAMDPRFASLTMARLRDLSQDGVGVLVAMHDLTMALNWSDDVIVLHEGTIHAAGPTRDVLQPETLSTVFGATFVRLEHAATSAIAVERT